MSILRTEAREIGGKTYQIRVLSVLESRKAYARVQKLLAAFTDDDLKTSGLGPILTAGLAGQLSDDDLTFYCQVFGPTTQVDFGDGRTKSLKDETTLNELFAGEFALMFEWITACIEVNFGDVIAKMKAALLVLAEQAAAKQASESQ